MIEPPDVFRAEEDGKAVWCEACADYDAAKARVKELSLASQPGRYFVSNQVSGQKQFIDLDTAD
jgi:hypothetical protein